MYKTEHKNTNNMKNQCNTSPPQSNNPRLVLWSIYLLSQKKIHLIVKVRHYLKLKGQKQIFQENGVRAQEEMSVHIPAKMHLKPLIVRWDF